MPSPSVSNTFANSTTADATQVNTNFTDLINAMSDGTKDFSISALTCAGTLTANGHVNLGNASGDDLTITASLASSVAIKTTATYNIGSATLGLLSIYIGGTGSFTTRLLSAATASWTLTLPPTAGTAGNVLANAGSGTLQWENQFSAYDVINAGIAASVSGNALTVALKGADGNDPSATNPVRVPFRSATAATGTVTNRTVTGALTTTVSSGSTLGHTSANAHYIYVYLLDNAGTVELAVSSARYDDGTIVTSVAEGGAGASDNAHTLYSTTARTNVACRLIGRLKSTQATAGTWATAISEISVKFEEQTYPQTVVISEQQAANTNGGTFTSGSYATRTLNTVDNDMNYPWVSLATNQFTLQPGTYLIEAKAPAGAVAVHKAKIRNTTDASDALIGHAGYSSTSLTGNTFAHVDGIITITAAKAFELQHRCGTTTATTGMGVAANYGDVEVYGVVKITKLSN